MRTRSIPVLLAADEYRLLCQLAAEQDRDPAQHARFIVRCALREASADPEVMDRQREREAA